MTPTLEQAAVSVVIPAYNAAWCVGKAIDSVLGQTLANWELILVDDGSTDASRRIAEGLAAREPARVRVVEHLGCVNRGLAASRNLGMEVARGKYLAFLDADDLYEPTRLERHVRVLEQDPRVGVVLSADLYWHEWQASAADPAGPGHPARGQVRGVLQAQPRGPGAGGLRLPVRPRGEAGADAVPQVADRPVRPLPPHRRRGRRDGPLPERPRPRRAGDRRKP